VSSLPLQTPEQIDCHDATAKDALSVSAGRNRALLENIPMHIADITMFYAPASGGVRTYLDAKRRWLRHQPMLHHSLLLPAAREAHPDERWFLPTPPLPLGHGYRFPLRREPWVARLVALEPDVIEAEDPYILPWAALEAGRRLQVPVVGFYHSDLPRLAGSRAGHWSNRLLNRYVQVLYRRFDRVLAPSRVMARKLRALGVDRVRYQPLGVDTERFHPRNRDPRLRESLGLKDDTRLLVFAGRGAREKNLPILLAAMQILGRGFHLHLVGSHMPRRLPDNVSRTRGFLAADEVARWLATADALVHAGDRETFGLVVLEAMASGTPVVGVRGGAIPELVAPGTGLLAEPLSPASMARTTRALFADGWHGMGRLARTHAVKHHAWDQVLPQLLDHYHELAGIPHAAHGSRLVKRSHG